MCIERIEFRAHCYFNRKHTFISKNRIHSDFCFAAFPSLLVACSSSQFWNTHFFLYSLYSLLMRLRDFITHLCCILMLIIIISLIGDFIIPVCMCVCMHFFFIFFAICFQVFALCAVPVNAVYIFMSVCVCQRECVVYFDDFSSVKSRGYR